MTVSKNTIWIWILIFLIASRAAPVAAADLVIYTALGDSLAFGALAPPLRGYVYRYRNDIAADTGATVILYDLGVPGWTSHDLRSALEGNFLFRALVAKSKVVTWNIGGNDLRAARNSYKGGSCGGLYNQDCLKAAVTTFKANWNVIMGAILSLRSPSNTIIRTMDIYNPFVVVDSHSDTWPNDGGLNDFQVLKPYLDQVNSHIATTASLYGVPYAPVYTAFNGPTGTEDPIAKGYIAFDAFHPNGTGHAVIANLLRLLGYSPLYP